MVASFECVSALMIIHTCKENKMEKVRIQDDLYNYVNGEWIENAVIPDDKPMTGGFADLSVGVEKTLIADFKEMTSKKEYPNDYIRRAGTLFLAVKNVKRRNNAGIRPVAKYLARISKLTGMTQFNRNLKEFVLGGYPLPFDMDVSDDMKDSNKHCLMISGPSTILPDTTYYKAEMKAQKDALIGIWRGMAEAVMAKTDLSEEDRKLFIDDTLRFDEIIASLVKSREEWSEYTKAYNPMKTVRVGTLLRPVKFKKLLENLFGTVPEFTVVADVRFLKGFSTLFNEDNFGMYKHWAYVTMLLGSTGLLSEELRELGSTYSRALTGVASIPVVEKYAYQLAGGFFSEPVGLYYGEKYFGEEAKKDIVEMVHEIIDTYKKRVRNSSILSDATKDRAILKLSTMRVKMGYPDSIDPLYDRMVFDEKASLFEMVRTLRQIRREDNFGKLYEPVDKSRWVMPGHMVNACYNPTANDITFPAAILQAPFYSLSQSRSQNLGGIGCVIGHEISHAFDNNGAQIDENGNLNNWWTKEDFKKFKKSTNAMIREFEGITLPWGDVNASLIVSENIADNGGMACTLDIMSGMKDADYEGFFINYAKVWCLKGKQEYLQLLLKVDVHGPAMLRTNMPPRNFPEWYKTFKVTSKDKMYIAPSKRVIVW